MTGRLGRIKIPLLLLLAGICALFLYYQASFTELFVSDAMEYAELGRSIARGEGFYASSLFPIRLAYEYGRSFPFASLRRPPFLPYFESLVFRVFGAKDSSVALSTGVFYLLLIPLTYIFSLKLFGNKKIAVLSAVFFILNGTALHYAISGLTELPFTFFITAALYLLIKRGRLLYPILVGLFLGLAQVTRPNAVLYLAPAILGLLVLEERKRKLKSVFFALLGFIVMYLPVLVYNRIHTGEIIFTLYDYDLLMGTKYSPVVLDIFRNFEKTDILRTILLDPQAIFKKALYGMYKFQNTFPQLLGRYFTAFFIVSIFRYYKDKNVNTERMLLYSLIAIQALFSSITIFDIRYCTVFLPLMIIFSAETLFYLVKEANPFMKRHSLFSGFILFFLAAFLLAPTGIQVARNVNAKFILKQNPGFYTPEDAYRKTGDLVKKYLPKGRHLIASDIGWVSAWYADRLSIKIPHTIKGLETIEKLSALPVEGILLSTDGEYWNDYNDEWKEVLFKNKPIPGYEKAGEFEEGSYKAVLFLRGKRAL